jgi:hypothetical protein
MCPLFYMGVKYYLSALKEKRLQVFQDDDPEEMD